MTEGAGGVLEKLRGVNPPLYKEAWHRMNGWYKDLVNRTPPPAWITPKRIILERFNLYHHTHPQEENIPLCIGLYQVEESVPTEDNIEWAVWRLRNNFSRVPSGMRAEHLKGCLEEAIKAEAGEAKVLEESAEVNRGGRNRCS